MDGKFSASMLISMMLLIIFGCTSTSTQPINAPEAMPQGIESKAREGWEEEWEKTLKAAQKEGRLNVPSSMSSVPARQAISENFTKKYRIEVDIVAGRGPEIIVKMLAERRAGLYLTDVYIGGASPIHTDLKPAGILQPLERAFILPELKDPEIIKKNWWDGKLRWLDKDRLVLGMLTYANRSITINTDLVKPGEIKGYADLLNPKWKGKIILDDPTMGGSGAKIFGVVGQEIMGWDYWDKMLKQEPLILSDQRLQTEWVARGKYAIGIGLRDTVVAGYVEAGAPLALISTIEGSYLSSGSGALAFMDRPPHPNAAKLFINWLLTREGQTIFSKPQEKPSHRVDVSTEGMDPNILLKPGHKYFDSDMEDFGVKQPEHYERARKLFAPLLK